MKGLQLRNSHVFFERISCLIIFVDRECTQAGHVGNKWGILEAWAQGLKLHPLVSTIVMKGCIFVTGAV